MPDLSLIGLQGQQAFYDRMNTAAQTRTMEVNADSKQLENEQTEAMNRLNELASSRLQSIVGGEKTSGIDPSALADRMTSLADPLEAAAKVYVTAGAGMETGMKLLQEAASIRKKEQEIDSAGITDMQNNLENMQKGFQVFRDTMGIAQNAEEWEFGKQQLVEAMRNGAFRSDDATIAKVLEQPWSPEARDYFNERTISAADQARLDFQEKQEQRLRQKALSDTAQAETRIELQRARDAQQVKYQDHLMKVTGKGGGPGTPNGVEIEQARDALSNTVFKGVTIKTADGKERLRAFDDAANYVASLAKVIVKENQALSWDQAVQQAIVRGQDAGVFTVDGKTPADPGWIFGLGAKEEVPGKAKFDRTGKTKDTAVQPPIVNGKVQVNKLVKGRYYMTKEGPGKFDGEGFILD